MQDSLGQSGLIGSARSRCGARLPAGILLTVLLASRLSGAGPMAAASAAGRGDFAGLDISGGRQMYMECRGSGSPTVVLISGKGNGAAEWSQILDPADPIRKSPYDMAGHEEDVAIYRSDSAVFPLVSRFTRVCACDRPGTCIDGKDISTAVSQPRTIDQATDDLHKLLAAAAEGGPYVRDDQE